MTGPAGRGPEPSVKLTLAPPLLPKCGSDLVATARSAGAGAPAPVLPAPAAFRRASTQPPIASLATTSARR